MSETIPTYPDIDCRIGSNPEITVGPTTTSWPNKLVVTGTTMLDGAPVGAVVLVRKDLPGDPITNARPLLVEAFEDLRASR